jgi:hypothetical protein
LERLTIKKAPQLLERLYGGEDGARTIQKHKNLKLLNFGVKYQ